MYWLLISSLLILSYERQLGEKTFWLLGALFGYYLWKKMYYPDKPKTIEKNSEAGGILFGIACVISCLYGCFNHEKQSYIGDWYDVPLSLWFWGSLCHIFLGDSGNNTFLGIISSGLLS